MEKVQVNKEVLTGLCISMIVMYCESHNCKTCGFKWVNKYMSCPVDIMRIELQNEEKELFENNDSSL